LLRSQITPRLRNFASLPRSNFKLLITQEARLCCWRFVVTRNQRPPGSKLSAGSGVCKVEGVWRGHRVKVGLLGGVCERRTRPLATPPGPRRGPRPWVCNAVQNRRYIWRDGAARGSVRSRPGRGQGRRRHGSASASYSSSSPVISSHLRTQKDSIRPRAAFRLNFSTSEND